MADSAPGMNLGDSVYERLLRERIIFLGSEVNDEIANKPVSYTHLTLPTICSV